MQALGFESSKGATSRLEPRSSKPQIFSPERSTPRIRPRPRRRRARGRPLQRIVRVATWPGRKRGKPCRPEGGDVGTRSTTGL